MHYLVKNVGVGVHACDARVPEINVGSLFTTALHLSVLRQSFSLNPKLSYCARLSGQWL